MSLEHGQHAGTYARCVCECGSPVVARLSAITRGKTKFCPKCRAEYMTKLHRGVFHGRNKGLALTDTERSALADRIKSSLTPADGECLVGPWASRTKDGYTTITVSGRVLLAHRAAFAALVGNIPPGAVVRHSCDNPLCCNPNHLSLGRDVDNVRDCIERGRRNQVRGDSHGRRKINSEDVKTIRAEYRTYENSVEILGLRFSICPKHIEAIANRRAWKSIP